MLSLKFALHKNVERSPALKNRGYQFWKAGKSRVRSLMGGVFLCSVVELLVLRYHFSCVTAAPGMVGVSPRKKERRREQTTANMPETLGPEPKPYMC